MGGRNKFPRRLSLKSRVEIRRLLKEGRRQFGDHLTCVWERSDRFRYGVFVWGKYQSSVGRNRLRRLVREAVRLNLDKLDQPVRVAILPRRDIGKPQFKLLNAEISRTFELINRAAR